jgi:hypothetical protein
LGSFVRLLGKAVTQIDLRAQLLRLIGQLLYEFGIGKP